ncbi:hypothetical protein PNEG_03500 [Pneumocystis murina B123]|uniref:DNA-directed RNA polymerase subunit n=1 Tax=Pneumocystis murina (strain B123) TaxID=1069680 RepID=M7P2F0_PNEMU|nr:hypothetical protein PNEG_03500 [Pneumocystis murina B123]EMR08060.1 hypothetical protein PNEG_03500 [Pneumocystis murina B123]
MFSVGSAFFCTSCGSLLDLISDMYIVCTQCRASYPTSDIPDFNIVTTSRSKAFGSSLRQMDISLNSLETDTAASIINETCPKCEYKKMRFQTLQMRSADEGATVFYECLFCGYRFSTNE